MVVGGWWWVPTHNVVKPTFTRLWLSWVLTIRSLVEYCAVVWHSSLTEEQINSIERVQKTCLRVILGENYVSYGAALEMCNLKTLFQRREDRCLSFA